MAPRPALAALLVSGLISLALSLAIQAGFAQEPAPTDFADADFGVQWAYRPLDLSDLTAESQAVVLAEVEAVRAGDPFVISRDIGGEEVSLPTQLVDVTAVETLAGSVPGHFSVFKLGGEAGHPAGDPAYTVGERHLLFVRRRLNDEETAPNADGTYLVTAPDGRFEELRSGELQAQVGGPVANELDGLSVAEADQLIVAAEASGGSE